MVYNILDTLQFRFMVHGMVFTTLNFLYFILLLLAVVQSATTAVFLRFFLHVCCSGTFWMIRIVLTLSLIFKKTTLRASKVASTKIIKNAHIRRKTFAKECRQKLNRFKSELVMFHKLARKEQLKIPLVSTFLIKLQKLFLKEASEKYLIYP